MTARASVLALVLAACPGLLQAQEAGPRFTPIAEAARPAVELQQSLPPATASDAGERAESVAPPLVRRAAPVPAQPAPRDEQVQARRWWLVGAILVAGIVLAILV